jgi:DNA polymerase III subunit delta'
MLFAFPLAICYYGGMNDTTLQAANQGWGIVGHEHTINTLRRALLSGRVRHAYLFTGPDHIGKTLLVRRFAQTLLCTGGPDPSVSPQNPCNTCLSCRKVMHDNHPDVHYIARPPAKQFILIDQVRVLQSDSARKTLEGRRNIFIITGLHEMNVQAANCLLKTLEEPEPDVVLLLTATDAGLLLPTILSRVQQIPMHLLATAQIKAALEQHWSVEAREAALVAALAAGRMGWAAQAIEDEDMLATRKTQLETLARLPSLSRARRFDVAQQLSADGDRLRGILELWLLWWRDMVLATHHSLDLIVNVDMSDLLEKQAARVGQANAQRMVRSILGTMEALDQNVNARTALEVLMLDLPTLR